MNEIDISAYRALLGHIPTAFIIIKMLLDDAGRPADFIFLFANNACCRLAGVGDEELDGRSFYSLFEQADKKWLSIFGDTAFSGRPAVVTEESTEIGKFLHIESYQISSGICGCFITDISAEMALEKELAMERESYLAAISNSQLHYWEYDIQNGTATQNDLSVRDLGVPRVMKNYPASWLDTNILLPQYWDRYIEIHKELKNGAKEIVSEHQVWPPKAKAPHWERIIYTTIFGPDGVPVKAIGTAIDISEEKRLEESYEEFKEYRDILANSSLDAFRLNVTKDTIVPINDSMELLTSEDKKLSMTEFFKKSQNNISSSEDLAKYRSIYDRGALIELYEKGNRIKKMECVYDVGDGVKRFLRFTVNLARNPLTQDIVGLTYTEDITEERLSERALQSVTDHDYEMIVRVNADDGSFVTISAARGEKMLLAESGPDLDVEIAKFTDKYIPDDAERARRAKSLKLANIRSELDRTGYLTYFYDVCEDGHTYSKELHFYYVDEDRRHICFTRKDVTAAALRRAAGTN